MILHQSVLTEVVCFCLQFTALESLKWAGPMICERYLCFCEHAVILRSDSHTFLYVPPAREVSLVEVQCGCLSWTTPHSLDRLFYSVLNSLVGFIDSGFTVQVYVKFLNVIHFSLFKIQSLSLKFFYSGLIMMLPFNIYFKGTHLS